MFNFRKRCIYVGVYAISTSIIIFCITIKTSVNNDGMIPNKGISILDMNMTHRPPTEYNQHFSQDGSTNFDESNANSSKGWLKIEKFQENPTIDWSSNIDICIIWAGQQKVHTNGTEIRRDRNNYELPFLLSSISKHAPWLRRVWILVNGENLPSKPLNIPASFKNRTRVIDRCTLMPAETCPTRNSFAASAFAHHLHQLSEWFIFVDDDTFLGRPVSPSHFFENGKPFVWRKKPTRGFFKNEEFHRLYKDPSVASFPTPLSSAPSPHFWFPQLKSVCASMQRQFPEFYLFLASHTGGRYSSLAKGVSDQDNSQEEDNLGFLNWELLRTGKGVYKNIESKRYDWWDEVDISEAGFRKALKDRPIFMNVNDRFSNDVTKYQEELGWFHAAMKEMFPSDPVINSTVIVGIDIPNAGSNKLNTMISESFNLISCNRLWANLSLDSARASIYCSWGKTITHPDVKKDVLRRLGTECNYLGTQQDMSIGRQLEGLRVSYVTMLREPISRLVSGCNYHLGQMCNYNTIVEFARSDRGYGMPNRMVKKIAGFDPVCSLESNKTALTDDAILDIAKTNIREKFIFVGILERLNESIALLPSSVRDEVVLPRLASRGGTFKGKLNKLTQLLAPYVNLDQQLYNYANQLLDAQLKKSGLSK